MISKIVVHSRDGYLLTIECRLEHCKNSFFDKMVVGDVLYIRNFNNVMTTYEFNTYYAQSQKIAVRFLSFSKCNHKQ